MDKEIFVKKMQVSGILFKYNVPINEAKIIGTFIEELEQQCKKQKEVIDELKRYLKLNIELIKEQPSNDELTDNFILSRFKSLLDILKEVSE